MLRRQVDFDSGNGERFDATTGTYTTGFDAVKESKKGKKKEGAQQQPSTERHRPNASGQWQSVPAPSLRCGELCGGSRFVRAWVSMRQSCGCDVWAPEP